MGIQITYHGHSCFVISCGDYRIAVDPYDRLPGYPPLALEAEEVICSHGHGDHANVKAVKLSGRAASAKEGIKVSGPFRITSFDIPHDDAGGKKRGMNKIHVFEADGVRVAHFGDIGCALPEEMAQALRGLDAAMVPVGGFYTIDAAGALALKEQIQPRVFIPMHYRFGSHGFDEIGTLDDFLALAGGGTKLDSNTLEVTGDAPSGIIAPAFIEG